MKENEHACNWMHAWNWTCLLTVIYNLTHWAHQCSYMCAAFKSAEAGCGRAGEWRGRHHSTICYSSNTSLPTFSKAVSTAESPKGLLLFLCKHPPPPIVKSWPNKWAVFHNTALQLIPCINLLLSSTSCWTKLQKTAQRVLSLAHRKHVNLVQTLTVQWQTFSCRFCLHSRLTHTIPHLCLLLGDSVLQGQGGHKIRHSAVTYFINRGKRGLSLSRSLF